jgi:hypothetical protein
MCSQKQTVGAALLAALIVILTTAQAAHYVHAQEAGRLDVFVAYDAAGTHRVYFLDALSGLSTMVQVESGRNFTLVGDYVLYEKSQTGAIMRANFNGTQEPHPFIRRAIDIQMIAWAVSPDGQTIAWVQTNTAGVSEAYVAQADGSDLRQLPISTPVAPLMLAPLALTDHAIQFFYDAAHTPGSHFDTYAHVALYNIAQEQFYPLPGEPNCPCGADVSADGRILARLESTRDGNGPFALHIWDLPSSADIYIPAPDLPYRLGGDLLLNPKGTLAVYTVASGVGSEENLLPESYGLVRVDLIALQQTLILPSGPIRYRPLAFVDGDSALLLTDVEAGGTFKLDLASLELRRVSDAAYLGTITLFPIDS